MVVTLHADGPSEYVSGIALEVLDELRIKMIECRLVLQALPEEADLNLDELEWALQAAHAGACQAYEAASLVHQGAQLDERWGSGWSRPKAVFARHGAAVRGGAPAVAPKPALGDRLGSLLWQSPPVDRSIDIVGARPKCAGTIRSTGEICTSSAIYLGAGIFGPHCYSHATREERERYRVHHDAESRVETDAYAELESRQRGVGEALTERWLELRPDTARWVNELIQDPITASRHGDP